MTKELAVIRRGPAILMDRRWLGLDKCFRFIKWNWSLMTEKTRRNMIRIVEPTVSRICTLIDQRGCWWVRMHTMRVEYKKYLEPKVQGFVLECALQAGVDRHAWHERVVMR